MQNGKQKNASNAAAVAAAATDCDVSYASIARSDEFVDPLNKVSDIPKQIVYATLESSIFM